MWPGKYVDNWKMFDDHFFFQFKNRINRIESMVELLKILAILRTHSRVTIGGYPFFRGDEFYALFSNAMKELIIISPKNIQFEFEVNRAFAEYLLE